ncbi:Uncharacterised protein [Clostridium putrefaciens]|uniref:HNH nuclease domain-containing protein n=2 Tax=Clostridium putrefaciens TaxID=99675 RepID=A0A381J6B3_9CLOT|nr:Uncharacterised protein [Clostridium putrefaciens]
MYILKVPKIKLRGAIMKKEYKDGTNEYEIIGNVAHIKLVKRKGTIVETKIDAENLQKVLAKGTWFPEWNSHFNNYLAQSIGDVTVGDKVYSRKQSMHSLILGLHPKAPIIHINGDTLDNRKENLQVYDQTTPNDFKELDETTSAIILRDKDGIERATAIIDKEDLKRAINSNMTWVYYKVGTQPHAVANTPEGRIFLNKFIMKCDTDTNVENINLNTLDNRKVNLKVKAKEEEQTTEK